MVLNLAASPERQSIRFDIDLCKTECFKSVEAGELADQLLDAIAFLHLSLAPPNPLFVFVRNQYSTSLLLHFLSLLILAKIIFLGFRCFFHPFFRCVGVSGVLGSSTTVQSRRMGFQSSLRTGATPPAPPRSFERSASAPQLALAACPSRVRKLSSLLVVGQSSSNRAGPATELSAAGASRGPSGFESEAEPARRGPSSSFGPIGGSAG